VGRPIFFLHGMVLALFACFSCRQACLAETPLRIGALLWLSGEYAQYGDQVRRGLELGNKAHGSPVELVFEDIGTLEGGRAVTAAHRLLQTEKIELGVVVGVDEAKPLGAIFSRKRVPLLVLWDSNQAVAGSGDYVFSAGFSTYSAGQALALLAVEKLGKQSLGVISQPSYYTELTRAAFLKTAQDKGIKVVFNEELSDYQNISKTVVSRLARSGPGALYVNTTLPQATFSLIREMRARKLEITILCNETFIGETARLLGKDAEGIFVNWIDSPNLGQVQRLYIERFGEKPGMPAMVALGFDGMDVIVKAFNSRQPTLAAALLKIIGPSRLADRQFSLFEYREGDLCPVQPTSN
jgi:branched-chain amino acid transport system substrate-binding protein